MTTTHYHPVIAIIGILLVVLNLAALLIWIERRLLALWQDRYGPNRVGPFGLLQPLADANALGAHEGDVIDITLDGVTQRLPLKIAPALPAGVAGVPVGLEGMPAVTLPAWSRLVTHT